MAWHVVIEVAWGPGGVFRDELYYRIEGLDELREVVDRAVNDTENTVPDGAAVTGVEKIVIYKDLEELCNEYDHSLDVCEEDKQGDEQ